MKWSMVKFRIFQNLPKNCKFSRKSHKPFPFLRHLQWNRATAIRCRGWSRGAHAPSRAAVDALSTAPTRASAHGSRMAGNPHFEISPANRRYRFPNMPAIAFQKRIRTCMRPARVVRSCSRFHFPFPLSIFVGFVVNPNSEVGNEIEKTSRVPNAVGRVTPCAPRLQQE